MLTMGLFLILRALSAYRSVLMVSSIFESAGLTQAIIKVWLLPPRESDEQDEKRVYKKHPEKLFCSQLTTDVPLFEPHKLRLMPFLKKKKKGKQFVDPALPVEKLHIRVQISFAETRNQNFSSKLRQAGCPPCVFHILFAHV